VAPGVAARSTADAGTDSRRSSPLWVSPTPRSRSPHLIMLTPLPFSTCRESFTRPGQKERTVDRVLAPYRVSDAIMDRHTAGGNPAVTRHLISTPSAAISKPKGRVRLEEEVHASQKCARDVAHRRFEPVLEDWRRASRSWRWGETSKETSAAGGAIPAGRGPPQAGPGRRSPWGEPLKQTDSRLSRTVPRSRLFLRDSRAGEHEVKRLQRNTVELSPGSTSWRQGDLWPAPHKKVRTVA
jgi:hypothetical protein